MTAKNEPTGQEVRVVDPSTGEVEVLDRTPLPSAADYGLPARVTDLIPTPDAWAEYPQAHVSDIIDLDQIIHDCMIFPSQDYEDSEWAILLMQDPITKNWFTTACGGAVLIRKLRQLQEMTRPDGKIGAFPIIGRILQKPSRQKGFKPYYDLV